MNKPYKENILRVYGREPETLDELAHCVIHMIESQPNCRHIDDQRSSYKVLGFAWDVIWCNMVSNSHNSPEGYPKNWYGTTDLPAGYPGWTGRVWIRYEEPCRDFGSTPFNKTLTYPGTGGAGDYDSPWTDVARQRFARYSHARSLQNAYPKIHQYSWDYRFYELDWPALALWVDQQRMWAELNSQSWNNRHRFTWTHPDVLAADAKFIAECATIKDKETA